MNFFYVLSEKEKGYSEQFKQFTEYGCLEEGKEHLMTDEFSSIYVKNGNIDDLNEPILGACSIELYSMPYPDTASTLRSRRRLPPRPDGAHKLRRLRRLPPRPITTIIIHGMRIPSEVKMSDRSPRDGSKEEKKVKVVLDDKYKDDIRKQLLDKVKFIGKILNAKIIYISTFNPSERTFYKNNGFAEKSIQMELQPSSPTMRKRMGVVSDRYVDQQEEDMIFNLPQSSRGGKIKTTSQKSKRKNKQRKITKKRNRISSKKRKYQKYYIP
jgi:hypothetical protein